LVGFQVEAYPPAFMETLGRRQALTMRAGGLPVVADGAQRGAPSQHAMRKCNSRT
jgi:hypothetical protein